MAANGSLLSDIRDAAGGVGANPDVEDANPNVSAERARRRRLRFNATLRPTLHSLAYLATRVAAANIELYPPLRYATYEATTSVLLALQRQLALTPAALKLFEGCVIKNVVRLNLSYNLGFECTCAEYLVASYPRVVSLDLSRTSIAAAGIKALAKLVELRTLKLYKCSEIQDDSVEPLCQLPVLSQLCVGNSGITWRGLLAFRDHLPDHIIEIDVRDIKPTRSMGVQWAKENLWRFRLSHSQRRLDPLLGGQATPLTRRVICVQRDPRLRGAYAPET